MSLLKIHLYSDRPFNVNYRILQQDCSFFARDSFSAETTLPHEQVSMQSRARPQLKVTAYETIFYLRGSDPSKDDELFSLCVFKDADEEIRVISSKFIHLVQTSPAFKKCACTLVHNADGVYLTLSLKAPAVVECVEEGEEI